MINIDRFYFSSSAPYFIDCISEHDLDELNVEIIRSTLYKVNNTNQFPHQRHWDI